MILAILAIVNLRGVKDTGAAFILPTFLFVGTLLTLIGVGVWKAALAGGHPMPVAPIPPALPATVGSSGNWMLMKAFASGCAAMTGVEAVSNGVMAFGEPRAKRAQRTLTMIIGILMVLLFGIAYLAKLYRVMPMDAGWLGLSELAELAGHGGVRARLVLLPDDGQRFAGAGVEREYGVCGFSAADARDCDARLSAACVYSARAPAAVFAWDLCADGIYGGDPDPVRRRDGQVDSAVCDWSVSRVYAVAGRDGGALAEGRRHTRRGWHMFVNGFGAVATGITTIVVLVAKFMAGAWVTALLVPALIGIMMVVKRHYSRVKREMADMTPLNLVNLQEPIVVIPMARWDRITEKAMRFGLLLSKEIKVVHVHSDDEEGGLDEIWDEHVMAPIKREGLQEPELVMIPSNYRFIINPLMDYILELEEKNPGRKVAVLLPELVVRHWWENALHNQRVQLLKLLLLLKGNQRIVVVNIPWYL